MILELDCGNSLIKWRIVDNAKQIITRGVSQHIQPLLADIEDTPFTITFCRFVSVRSEPETAELLSLLKTCYPLVKQALSSNECLGIKNGYKDYRRLGADRWAAIVASYYQNNQATLILGFGTAITSDFIDNQGQHLGGFIAPGLLLMRQQLLTNTGRIHYNESLVKNILAPIEQPGVSTEDAVNGGCHLMLQSFISQQLTLATSYLGKNYIVYVTGGDAIHFTIPQAQYVPDLVFDGLALLCPIVDS